MRRQLGQRDSRRGLRNVNARVTAHVRRGLSQSTVAGVTDSVTGFPDLIGRRNPSVGLPKEGHS